MKPSADPGRTLMPAYFSSEREDWRTPRLLLAELAREFGPFDLDPCATGTSACAPYYFDLARDGLAHPWHDPMGWEFHGAGEVPGPVKVFMNPPYGRIAARWMAKAALEGDRGARVVCLVPARTDTRWWHESVEPHAALVRFLKGRVHFVMPDGTSGPSPFPSAVVVYDRTWGPGLRVPCSGWVRAAGLPRAGSVGLGSHGVQPEPEPAADVAPEGAPPLSMLFPHVFANLAPMSAPDRCNVCLRSAAHRIHVPRPGAPEGTEG